MKRSVNTYTSPIKIHKIYTSPGHNYFTREKFNLGENPIIEHETILCEENKGFVGDRFEYSTYPITLFSLEVAEEVCNSLDIELNLELFRRNIILSGVNLGELIGKRFIIDNVEFEGLEHCAPCPWMNVVMKKGAYALMRGRGGLRVKPIRNGVLHLGNNNLISYARLDKSPLEALPRPKIP
jgi:hypothetical protein